MNRHFITTVAICSMALTLTAFAHKGANYSNSSDNMDWSKNWYIGAGINTDAKFTFNADFDDTLDGTSDKFESSSNNVGFDAYLGREVNEHLAVEFGYTYIGDVNFDGTVSDVKVEEATVKQWDVDLVGVGRWAIGEYFNLMIKGGIAWYDNHQEVKLLSTGVAEKEDFDGFALTYGGGLEVAWDQFAVRGDYTVIRPAESMQDTLYISDLVGLSLIYKFM